MEQILVNAPTMSFRKNLTSPDNDARKGCEEPDHG